jgi:hypothetical protein
MGKPYKIYGRIYKLKDGSEGRQLFLTIPTALAEAKGIKEGSEVVWQLDNVGNLILRPRLMVV